MPSRVEDGYDASYEKFQHEFSAEFSAPLPALTGDWYHEPDDVRRGITLPTDFAGMGFSQFDDGGKFDDALKMFSNPGDEFQAFDERLSKQGTSSSPSKEFQDTDVPPALSEERKLYLEPTALHLSSHTPAAAGNSFLAFLRQIDAHVNKVNQKKFTLKASVILDGLPCDIKVYMFQRSPGTIMEFQRRSGDSLAFTWLFRQASEFFQCPSGPSTRMGPPKLPGMVALPPDHAIAPLLDVADTSEDLNVLSEVASTLAAMAQDPEVAAQLRMPCAFSAMQRLQEVSDFRVALPTSRLLAYA